MYGSEGVGITGGGVVAGVAVLPNTGGNTLFTVMVGVIIAVGTIATLIQLGVIAYRRKALSNL